MTARPATDPKLDLVLERVIDVPRRLVWEAWTRPEHLKEWFCPKPWGVSDCEIDLRPGGIFRTHLLASSLAGMSSQTASAMSSAPPRNREPRTTSHSPAAIGSISEAMSWAECWPSASNVTMILAPRRRAKSTPVCSAAP